MTSRRSFVGSTLASALTAELSLAAPLSSIQANAATHPARKSQWEPAKTWVVVIGILAYPDGQDWPEEGRRDAVMIEKLRKAGVPANQISFIRNQEGTLANVEKKFAHFLAQAPADAFLWFYFAGHGDKTEDGVGTFLLYDKEWPIAKVLTAIEKNFKGHTGLLFADCCYSGNLGLEALLRAGRLSYAALSSSLSSTVSTGSWTFTNCLIDALDGSLTIDDNGDGKIDFLELAAYAEREMAVNEGQLSTFVAVNGFDPRMVISSGKPRSDPRVGQYVSAKAKDGEWYRGRIEAVDKGRFQIRWAGYDLSQNEWVAESNCKPLVLTQYPCGTTLSVSWKKKWYAATVLASRLGMHLVHYADFSSHWDEWVDDKRIKHTKK